MSGWSFAFCHLLILSAIARWCGCNIPKNYRYDAVRKWRTSRVSMLFKTRLIMAVPM